MASEILSQMQQVATIEEIDQEQGRIRREMTSLQNDLDALEVFRRVLVVARDGKPERQRRGPRTPKANKKDQELDDSSESDMEESVVQIEKDDPGRPCVERCIHALNQTSPLSIGELSHLLKVQYSTVYAAIAKDSRFVKRGQKWDLRRKS